MVRQRASAPGTSPGATWIHSLCFDRLNQGSISSPMSRRLFPTIAVY